MKDTIYKNEVSVIKTIDNYNIVVPFNPPKEYPELSKYNYELSNFNPIYDSVRQLFILLELDKDRMDSSNWNPLSEIITPGNKVFIKPNLVMPHNRIGQDPNSTITHASVIRPIVDYIYLALEGKGEIIIGDAPNIGTDFCLVNSINYLAHMIGYLINFYNNKYFKLSLIDLRFAMGREEQFYEYDYKGIEIDLKEDSYFNFLDDKSLRSLTYHFKNNAFENKVHNRYSHKYRVAKECLEADVIISVPKMKTHVKSGVTLNLKNIVGVTTNKLYIPHYRIGSPSKSGDEMPDYRMIEKIKKQAERYKNSVIRRFLYTMSNMARDKANFIRKVEINYRKVKPTDGSWEGNDTIWRVILDLNKIMFFANTNGVLRNNIQRTFFYIVDGIIGVEKNGPLAGLKNNAGVLLGGYNPFTVDLVTLRLMGFDYKKIPLMKNARKDKWLFHEGPISVVSNLPEWNTKDLSRDYYTMMPDLDFIEPDNWHIKIKRPIQADTPAE